MRNIKWGIKRKNEFVFCSTVMLKQNALVGVRINISNDLNTWFIRRNKENTQTNQFKNF